MSTPTGTGLDTVHGDNLDVAADLQQKLNDAGIQQARQRMAPEEHPDFDGKNCVDCGDGLPKLRIAMKRVRCVVCQDVKERKEKGL